MHALSLHQDICRQFAALLSYPDERIAARAAACATHLDQFSPAGRKQLEPFLQYVGSSAPTAVEEAFTNSFDLQAACHPYVGYQLCGESQQRTFFMIKLQEIYRDHGFAAASDLPDHFCEVLRFIGAIDAQGARLEIIRDGLLPALEKMTRGIETGDSAYLHLLKALQTFLNDSLAGDDARPIPDRQKESLS
ncbi:MAG TPA: nitrate reductase molybdenum cofactor assembly chaperone [Desulfuromonadales bacterium]|nr:nitrate reductase molybdenum cofactor assembly chaperone [Desulfuromonadales bacterium]